MILERAKWTDEQAATPEDMLRRIEANPQLCIGAFATDTGEALASLFAKPITVPQVLAANTWADCARMDVVATGRTRSLFGISLTSTDQEGIDAVRAFFWPVALKGGWREIYLGSPLPGLRAWRSRNPEEPVETYVHSRRGNGLPLDPQLFYYHGKGFDRVVACKPDYFPHERSIDYGAVIRASIPVSAGAPLWQVLPLGCLRRMTRFLESRLPA
jgi:hypothetical protein